MDCHECARTGGVGPAVALCRFCMVGLCKEHLVAAFHGRTVPQYGCSHHPELAFAPGGPPSHRASTPVPSRAA